MPRQAKEYLWFRATDGSRLMVNGSGLRVQGMKRQNGISKMKSINMGDDKKGKIMIVHGEHKDDVTLANIQARIFLVRGVQVMQIS